MTSRADSPWSVMTGGVFGAGYPRHKSLLWEAERRSAFAAGEGEPPSMRGGQSSEASLARDAAPGQAPLGEARTALEKGEGAPGPGALLTEVP